MKTVLLLIFSAFISAGVMAQTSNESATTLLNEQGYFGYFNHKLDATHAINVNYGFSPKVPTNTVNIMLHTPTARPLSVKIVDASSKVVKTWEPTTEVYLYEAEIDISDLKAGSYTYQILWDGVVTKSINFNKL